MHLAFNTNDVPKDLNLVFAALRIYQLPKLQNLRHNHNITIIIYRKTYNRKLTNRDYLFVTSLSSTKRYKGWLEFNITQTLAKWLQHTKTSQAKYEKELMIEVTSQNIIPTKKLSLVSPNMINFLHKHPFIISYFNGPELVEKIHSLRFKRNVLTRKAGKANIDAKRTHVNRPHQKSDIYKLPTHCERLNFTLDFKDLQMHNWVIAPKKFEAFFCGGECTFPLGSRMNATNHAIVQTLMHLKQPKLPKPCCVPTVLGSITILHYLNEDSVNLSKYPQSVAKQCGCH